MRYILVLMVFLLCTSCYDRLDDNKRGFFKITTVDSNNAPIENMTVTVRSGRFYENDFYSMAKLSDDPEEFVLGTGMTDAQGNVSFLMLVNSDRENSVELISNPFFEKHLILDDLVFSNSLEYDMSQVVLKPKSEININFDNQSGTTELFNVSISYESITCQQVTGTVNPPVFDCNRIIETCLNDEFCNEFITFNAVFPSTITVDYSDQSGNMFTEQFQVTNNAESYDIQY